MQALTAPRASLRSRLAQLDFTSLFAFIIVSRLLILPGRIALLVRSGGPTDLPYFLQMARLSDKGLYPYLHFWVEYPPIFPGLVMAAYRLSRLLGQGAAADAWFYTLISAAVVACELGVFVVLYRIALLVGTRETARRSAWLYAFLFVPGYLYAVWFDHLPVFFFVLALYLLLKGKLLRSAAFVGLGFVSKLFPILLVPLTLCVERSMRRRVLYLAVVGAVITVFVLPLLTANPPMLLASIRTAFTRPSWETVWALIDGYHGYGVVAPLAEHFDAASASWKSHEGLLPGAPVTLVFGLLYLLFYIRFHALRMEVGNRSAPRIVAGAAYTLILLLLYSRGYSPQYLTWLAPLIVILLPNRRGALYLGLLGLLNLIELPGYFSFFPDQPGLLVFTVLARTSLLIALARDCYLMDFAPAFSRLHGGGDRCAPHF